MVWNACVCDCNVTPACSPLLLASQLGVQVECHSGVQAFAQHFQTVKSAPAHLVALGHGGTGKPGSAHSQASAGDRGGLRCQICIPAERPRPHHVLGVCYQNDAVSAGSPAAPNHANSDSEPCRGKSSETEHNLLCVTSCRVTSTHACSSSQPCHKAVVLQYAIMIPGMNAGKARCTGGLYVSLVTQALGQLIQSSIGGGPLARGSSGGSLTRGSSNSAAGPLPTRPGLAKQDIALIEGKAAPSGG